MMNNPAYFLFSLENSNAQDVGLIRITRGTQDATLPNLGRRWLAEGKSHKYGTDLVEKCGNNFLKMYAQCF